MIQIKITARRYW